MLLSPDFYTWHFSILLLGSPVIYALYRKTKNPYFTLAMAYTALLCVYGIYATPLTKHTMLFHNELLISLVSLCFIFFSFLIPAVWVHQILDVLCIFSTAVTATIYFFPNGYPRYSGLLVNPSLNAVAILLTVPFTCGYTRLALELLSVPLIFVTESTTAAAVYVVIKTMQLRRPWLVFLMAPFLFMHDFFGKTRWQEYLFFWEKFKDHINPLIGSGPNTFYFWGPYFQNQAGRKTDYWLWLHSDAFQLLFEQGIIGFILWGVALSTIVFKKQRFYRPENQALVGWLVSSITYFPIHSDMLAFIFVLLIRLRLS